MMERIELARLVRETTPSKYHNLVTRPMGAAVRTRVQERISASPHPTTHLDFASIDLLDFSCADEVVAKLLLGDPGDRPRFVVLVNVTESHRDAIEQVLETHGLTVAAISAPERRPCMLGWRTPDLVAVFDVVLELGAGDATRVADSLGWTVERAADALQSLALRRLVQAASGTYRPLPLS